LTHTTPHDADRIFRYLSLFGLDEHFTEDELVSAYHTLAKLNHPDITDDPGSEMRMVIINEAYRFLREERDTIAATFRVRSSPDPVYEKYRRAFALMSAAFVDYYGEGDKKLENDITQLRERLSAAKDEFAALIEQFPASRWTSDSIDRVFSINKWL
jgi:curved DNA-binding protein CbpA